MLRPEVASAPSRYDRRVGALCLIVAFCLVPAVSLPDPSTGGEFELTRYTIDAGGGTTQGSTFELIGTVAQAEADRIPSAGGEFLLAGGFWATAGDRVFANGFEE